MSIINTNGSVSREIKKGVKLLCIHRASFKNFSAEMFSTSYLGTLFALNYSTINIKNKQKMSIKN
jgi:hypothetical protein